MKANGDGPFRQQGRGIFTDDGVRVINAEHKERFTGGGRAAVLARRSAGGEFISTEGVFRAEVTRTDAVSTTEKTGGFRWGDFR
jgi:hypothetical protein